LDFLPPFRIQPAQRAQNRPFLPRQTDFLGQDEGGLQVALQEMGVIGLPGCGFWKRL
jgi:hypothetical protein